mgnify:CR=1 FL=1
MGVFRDGGSWYIRVPFRRILEYLAFAYVNGYTHVNEGLVAYLKSIGLRESNARVMTPTLSALGLVEGGMLTNEAFKIGELYSLGALNAVSLMLRRLAMRNAALRHMLNDGVDLASLGFRRSDELNYTMQFINFLKIGLLSCQSEALSIMNGSCMPIPPCCERHISYLALSRVNIQEALIRLDLNPSLYEPVINGNGLALVNVATRGDSIPVAYKVSMMHKSQYPSSLRVMVSDVEDSIRRARWGKAIILIPILLFQDGECSMKAYLASYTDGVLTYANVFNVSNR